MHPDQGIDQTGWHWSTPIRVYRDVNYLQVPEDLPTVFRVLKVRDVPHAHVIRNMLLDWTSAERLLLVDVRPFSPLPVST